MAFHNVFVVDDHPLVLSGIQELINGEDDLDVVGVATTAQNAIDGIEQTHPEIAIIDVSLCGTSGIALVEQLHSADPSFKIIVLTAHEEPTFVRQALTAGALGFVSKQSAVAELLNAVRMVLNGGSYVAPGIAARAIAPSNVDHTPDILSQRELTVLKFVALGYCNKEISFELNLSIKTVETYRIRALEKLELKTRAALVRFAHRNGWLAEL